MKYDNLFNDTPLFYDDKINLPKESEVNLDQLNAKLDTIIEILDRIEKKQIKSPTQNHAEEVKLIQPTNHPGLYPPANAVPKNSMLGEIQSVLASQSITERTGEAAGDVITDACALPSSMYDDNI